MAQDLACTIENWSLPDLAINSDHASTIRETHQGQNLMVVALNLPFEPSHTCIQRRSMGQVQVTTSYMTQCRQGIVPSLAHKFQLGVRVEAKILLQTSVNRSSTNQAQHTTIMFMLIRGSTWNPIRLKVSPSRMPWETSRSRQIWVRTHRVQANTTLSYRRQAPLSRSRVDLREKATSQTEFQHPAPTAQSTHLKRHNGVLGNHRPWRNDRKMNGKQT